MQKLTDAHNIYADTLEAIRQQLLEFEAPKWSPAETTPVLQRILVHAYSADLESYVRTRRFSCSSGARTAEELHDNFELIKLLSEQIAAMRDHHEAPTEENSQATDNDQAALADWTCVDVSVVDQASLLAALNHSAVFMGKLTAGLSLDTSPEQLASYITLVRLKPYLNKL